MSNFQQVQKYWIAVASAEHARRGRAGFMQVNHGKRAPLKRIGPGDGLVYYAPTETFRGHDKLQAFILIGHVEEGDIYQGDMGEGFTPWRRNVNYVPSTDAPIRPMLDDLEFTRGKTNWGYQFRFGLFEISTVDFELIAEGMHADFG